MTDDDKYPAESDRRRFVKGVVGGAALGSVGTVTAATVQPATFQAGEGGGNTTYFGIENTDGPAPRGMPMIPIRIDDEGFLRGLYPEPEERTVDGEPVLVAETEIAGVTYSPNWFQYCGVQSYQGLAPSADQDDYFRYSSPPVPYEWQSENVEPGDRVNVSDFEDYRDWGNDIGQSGIGKPAAATWRSVDVPSTDTIPVQILRIPPDVLQQMREDSAFGEWLDAASEQNFVAWLNKCTHFCCVPGFKTSRQSLRFDAGNRVYCPCHQSVYDPYSIVNPQFTALPRPEE